MGEDERFTSGECARERCPESSEDVVDVELVTLSSPFPVAPFVDETAHVGERASSAPTPAISREDIERDLNARDFDLKTGRRNFKSGFSSFGGDEPNLFKSTFFIPKHYNVSNQA